MADPPATGATGGPTDGVRVVFLVGKKDAFLDDVKAWADAIKKGVPAKERAGVIVKVMPQPKGPKAGPGEDDLDALAATIKEAAKEAAAAPGLSQATLDSTFGGLRETLLVLLTHGTGGEDKGTGGVLLWVSKDRHGVALDERVLIHGHTDIDKGGKDRPIPLMRLDGQTIVTDVPAAENPELVKVLRARIKVLQAIRDATVWRRIYLAACGASSKPAKDEARPRLDSFARDLAALTGKTILHNEHAIYAEVTTTGAKKEITAWVGHVDLEGQEHKVTGTPLSGSGAQVTLEGTATTFLPGNESARSP